jgi:hypothetical protein
MQADVFARTVGLEMRIGYQLSEKEEGRIFFVDYEPIIPE